MLFTTESKAVFINFCYNATLHTGAVVELQKVQKKGLHKAQFFLEKHGIGIGMTAISKTLKPRECDIPNQQQYIQLLQPQVTEGTIVSVTLEFVRA